MISLLESLITRKNLERTRIVAKDGKHLKRLINNEMDEKGIYCDLNFIDVSNLTDLSYAFCYYKFNGDISDWDVSRVKDTSFMFAYSHFNGDISDWDVSNVESMCRMFNNSKFSKDISSWKLNPKCDTSGMFYNCPIPEKFKPNVTL